jgi:hypothetical protein
MNGTHEGMWNTENILSFSHPLVLFVRVLARGAGEVRLHVVVPGGL